MLYFSGRNFVEYVSIVNRKLKHVEKNFLYHFRVFLMILMEFRIISVLSTAPIMRL